MEDKDKATAKGEFVGALVLYVERCSDRRIAPRRMVLILRGARKIWFD
ncbi:hypothetical protein HanIR_Chr17g0871191 [Helianthus annuus]|nr:hypothetical protein HanIR_Chr17g0871191 [Helianthus annuus]